MEIEIENTMKAIINQPKEKTTMEILTEEVGLTNRLMTIFNSHHDAMLREIKSECHDSLGYNYKFNKVLDAMVFYIQEDMGFPDSATTQDFLSCIWYSLRGQEEDTGGEGN